MNLVDVVDETFLVATDEAVAARLRDPDWWRACWPGLKLSTYDDRGVEGLRWTVAGELIGTAEVWLQPWRDGVIVHVYLRADPADGASGNRRVRQARERHVRRLKQRLFALKDALEAGRTPGQRPPWAGESTSAPPAESGQRAGPGRTAARVNSVSDSTVR